MTKQEDITVRCLRMIGRTPEEQIETTMKAQFAHFYNCWKILRDKFGLERTSAKIGGSYKESGIYWKLWDGACRGGFKAILASKGIEDPKTLDAPTLGKVMQDFFQSVPCLYEIIEETPSRHVGIVRWCPNPKYGPLDTYFDRIKYYENEAEVTRMLFEEAIDDWCGLSDKLESSLESAICCGADVCKFVFEQKGGKK